MEPLPSKTQLRQELRQQISGLSDAEKAQYSRTLCERLIQDPRLQAASHIGIYLPLPDEPDLRPALRSWLTAGKTLALPFLQDDGSWFFRQIDQLEGAANGPFGLCQPEAGPTVHPRKLEVILVPGRGFTAQGDRLGRGKGIYDRLLADTTGLTLGIAFPCQMRTSLPREPHDVLLQEVWTG